MRGNLTFNTSLGMTSAKEWSGNGGYIEVISIGLHEMLSL